MAGNKGIKTIPYFNTVEKKSGFSRKQITYLKIIIKSCFCKNIQLAIKGASLSDESTNTETIYDWYSYCLALFCPIRGMENHKISAPTQLW
ncbi:LOW QUALITY PROTEIN: hypothetical protein HZS_98 [Henneguya salminicola]|nr:LOW QUALITY PROTEIN: hypothetical protein HZS_98 [Henneguya salminicola]